MVVYHPKLSCRRAEISAYSNLSEIAQLRVCPWFILKPKTNISKDIEEQVYEQVALLGSAFGRHALLPYALKPIFLQTSKIIHGAENFDALQKIWSLAINTWNLNFIPVLRISDIDGSSHDLLKFINQAFGEVCVVFETNEDKPNKMKIVNEAVRHIDGRVNFNIDVGSVSERFFTFKIHEIRGVSRIIENLDISGTLSISAAGFPESLSSRTRKYGKAEIRRFDQDFFNYVIKTGILPQTAVYGDYTTVYPNFEPVKIPPKRHNAYLRYTGPRSWQIFRGGNMEEHGHRQIHRLSQRLVSFNPHYRGPHFSFGDRCISD
jgi:hypothetical protein